MHHHSPVVSTATPRPAAAAAATAGKLGRLACTRQLSCVNVYKIKRRYFKNVEKLYYTLQQ